MQNRLIRIIILFLFLMLPMHTYAANGNFASTAITIEAGNSFTLSINVSNLVDATTVETILEYDPTVLTFISAEADSSSLMAPINEIGIMFATTSVGALERMSVSVPSESAINGDGKVVDIVFNTANNASGYTNIKLHDLFVYTFDFNTITADTGNDLVVSFTSPPASAPIRSNALPSGTLTYDTTQVDISLDTDKNAICRFSANSDIAFDNQTIFSTTGGTSHSHTINGLISNTAYTYYVKCRDELNNTNTTDYLISFFVDTETFTPPSSGGGGGGGSSGLPVVDDTPPGVITNLSFNQENNGLKLTWQNPIDSDYDKTLIFRLGSPLPDYNNIVTVRNASLDTKETSLEYYLDATIDNFNNFYVIYTQDSHNNHSQAVISKKINEEISLTPSANDEATTTKEKDDDDDGNNDNTKITNLLGVKSEIVEAVSQQEAKVIKQNQIFVSLNPTEINIYGKVMANKTIENTNVKYRIAYFIHYGTPTTKSLGAGERGGVINSYYSAFNKMPISEKDWQDIIKIANGRWPTARNIQLEEHNRTEIFKQIYKRVANMSTAHDNAAITVITYGLRPLNRNLDSEKTAIKFFKGIFKYNPSNAKDWDIVRAIAYSGAIR